MAYHYILHPMAQKEYESSVAGYLKRSLRAAANFVTAIEKGLSNMCNNPEMFRNEYKHYHECTIRKYPFTIVYTIDAARQLVVIIAIYHQKREPSEKYR